MHFRYTELCPRTSFMYVHVHLTKVSPDSVKVELTPRVVHRSSTYVYRRCRGSLS